jgi:histidinol-phosphate aminotransferase
MNKYQKPAELYDGLRLHQNENTGGCSPRVIEALAALRPEEIGFYPPYEAATRACAEYLGVDPDHLSLLNGLDEGIMCTAIGYLRSTVGGPVPEAVIPDPAFEIFAIDTEVIGATPVRVPPNPDFRFRSSACWPQSRAARASCFSRARTTRPASSRRYRRSARWLALPPGGIVFVDEACHEFCGQTFIPELSRFPNVVVGRTFSKAFGLAGIRIGAVTGHPDALEPIRLAVPVYSVNIAAVAAVQAALEDRAHLQNYLAEVERSKTLLYAACDRLGLTC